MIQAQNDVTHDCTLPHYVTEIQKIVGDYESLTRQVAHFGAHDERFSEVMIATLTSLNDMRDQLEQPDRHAKHMQSIASCVDRVEHSALKRVCTRCMQSQCPAVLDDTVVCDSPCHTCGTSTKEHDAAYQCSALCAATRTITIMSEHAKHQFKTGAPEDDEGDELEKEHARIHASCSVNPCPACQSAAASTEVNASTQTSPSLKQHPIALPVDTVRVAHAHLDDEAIIAAFQSLQVHGQTNSTETQTEPGLNVARVCNTCHKHFTGCTCLTPAQTELQAEKAKRTPLAKQGTIPTVKHNRPRQEPKSPKITTDPFDRIDFPARMKTNRAIDPCDRIEHPIPPQEWQSTDSGHAALVHTNTGHARFTKGNGDAMPCRQERQPTGSGYAAFVHTKHWPCQVCARRW